MTATDTLYLILNSASFSSAMLVVRFRFVCRMVVFQQCHLPGASQIATHAVYVYRVLLCYVVQWNCDVLLSYNII